MNAVWYLRIDVMNRRRSISNRSQSEFRKSKMNTPFERTSKRQSILFYMLLAAAMILFFQTFALLSPIYLSFLLTLLIALALNPLVNRLRTIMGGRKGATAAVILLVLSVFALSGWAFYIPLRDSISDVTRVLPGYWERLQKPLIKIEQQAKRTETRMQAEVNTEVSNAADPTETVADPTETVDGQRSPDPEPSNAPKDSNTLRDTLAQMLMGVVGSFTRVAFNGAQILMVLVTVFFGVIFMLLNPRPIIGAFFSFVPAAQHDKATAIMERICKFAPAWGGATLAGMLTIGSLVFLLMWPLLGLMDALVLGLIAGLLESIPFLGPTLSTVPALLLATGRGGMTPLWVLLAYVGVQAMENNVILPMIMARGMKLHALSVIFSMLLCVSAFGVLGVLIAAPLVAIGSIFHEELYRKKFLPTVTDADLDILARNVLHEKGVEID